MNATITRSSAAALGVALLVAVVGCSGEPAAEGKGETRTLVYASFVPEDHPYSLWFKDWAEEVTERTEGRIQFETYYAEALMPATELAPAAADGRVDIVQTNTNYHPDMFPLSEISAVPYENPQIAASVKAFTELYEEYEPYTQEFEGNNLVPLQFQPTGSSVIGATAEMNGIADLAKKRIRANSFLADWTAAHGGDPISMPLSDVYQSVDTGLLDGLMTVLENFPQYSLSEVVTTIADPGVGPNGLSAMLMNLDTYNSLSEEDRAILDELNADRNQRWAGEMLTEMDADTCKIMKDAEDVELVAWSEAEISDAKAASGDSFAEQFVQSVDEAGGDGAEFLEMWRDRQADYDGSFGEYRSSVASCLG